MKRLLFLTALAISSLHVSSQSIINPSFEDGTNGWTVTKMQLQTNDGMSNYKAGNTYVERWIAAPGLLGHAAVKQTVTGLANGVYRLTAAAMNISQNNESASQVGAYIVGNGLRTTVTTRNTYTLDFFVTDGTSEIGFVAEGASGNWVACDNFTLTYRGNTASIIQDAADIVRNHANSLVSAYGSDSEYNGLLDALNSAMNTGNLTNTAKAAKDVVEGERSYRLRHSSGSAPVVTTNPRHARGSIWIFGRMTRSGSNIVEEGFCWSTHPNPTIEDHYTTDWIDSNGKVIWMSEMLPGTMYYVRAYAMTRNYAVGYGEVIKVPTLPQGNIGWGIRDFNESNANHTHLKSSAEWAFDHFWSNLTQLTTFYTSIGHNSGVPTAECSRGGWMSVGDNWSYQLPGTLMHEALHGVGVGTHWMWSDFTRNQYPVWDALRFWDNNESAVLSGDSQHMWPYGINGAHEDNGSDQLYIGNSLICEALGEAGLPLTDSQWLLPYYAFPQDDDTKYYLKCEDKERGLTTSYLVENSDGSLGWKEMSAEQAKLSSSNAAWYATFDASIQKYHFKNASTNHFLVFKGNDSDTGFKAEGRASDIQMKKCRVDVKIGSATYNGYYLLDFASGQALEAKSNGKVGSTGFSIYDDATKQRWVILTEDDMPSFESYAVELKLDELRRYLNGYKTAKNVAHTDKVEGATTALANTLNTIETAITGSPTMEQVLQYISDIKEAGLDFLNKTVPSGTVPYDLTFLVQNPSFTDSADGWSLAPTRDYGAVEFYQTTFDFYQILPNMPAGTYQLTANAFQRPGANADVYSAYQAGNDEVNTVLYINSTAQKVMNVMAEQQNSSISNGEYKTAGNTYVPNNMEAGSAYFARGKYANSVQGECVAGNLRIGLRGTVSNNAYWTMADNFKLYYYGTNSEITTLKEQLAANGFSKITALPSDYSPYFFVLYDHDQDLAMVLKNPAKQGGSKSAWYDGLSNPMTNKETLWTIDSYTQGGAAYQVLANASYPHFMLQTEMNAGWNYRCSDNGAGNPGWGRTTYAYQPEGYWTVQNGVYPEAGYLGPWDNVITDNAEMALNKTGGAQGHFDLFTILRGDWVKRFDAGMQEATYEEPLDITYVLENPGAERRANIGWMIQGEDWWAQGNDAFNGKVGGYYMERWNANGAGSTEIYQEIQGLPDGYYRLSAIGFVEGEGQNFYLYANDAQKTLPSANAGNRYNVVAQVTNGILRVGVKAENVTAKWIAFDDVKLEYLGLTIPGYNMGTPTSNIEDGSCYADSQVMENWTLEFTGASSNVQGAAFAILDTSARAALYKGDTKVGDYMIYLSGTTVTVSFNDLALDTDADYRLEFPAAVVGYAGQVSNEAVTINFHTPALFDGTYYLYNSYSKNYMSRGGAWGTAAILDNWGLALQAHTNAEGQTTLKYFDSQQFLYSDGWCYGDGDDASALKFTVTKNGTGYLFLNQSNNRYLAVNNNAAVGDAAAGDNLVGSSNVWAIETPAEHAANYTRCADEQAATAATAASLKNVSTFADMESLMATAYAGIAVDITGGEGERYQWYSSNSNPTNESEYYKETVGNLPSGLYRLTVNAFQRAAWFNDVFDAEGARGSIYLYANDAKTQIKSVMEYGATTAYTGGSGADVEYDGLHYPNSMEAGFDALATGNYRNVVYVYVGDGSLTFGINNPNRLGQHDENRGTWAMFQGFRLERMVHVLMGDVNNDGQISIADVAALVDIVLGKDEESDHYNYAAADFNGDGSYSVADVMGIVDIIIGRTD